MLGHSSGGFSAHGHRAGQLVVYAYEPGVVVRAYWRAPWRHRHYFPATGQQPWAGRDEDLSAPSEPYPPAKTFRRSWSNTSAFEYEVPRARSQPVETQPAPYPEPAPRIERFEPHPGPFK